MACLNIAEIKQFFHTFNPLYSYLRILILMVIAPYPSQMANLAKSSFKGNSRSQTSNLW